MSIEIKNRCPGGWIEGEVKKVTGNEQNNFLGPVVSFNVIPVRIGLRNESKGGFFRQCAITNMALRLRRPGDKGTYDLTCKRCGCVVNAFLERE